MMQNTSVQNTLPRIVITTGEPAGIGPDIAILAAQMPWPMELVVVADENLLTERAKQLNCAISCYTFDPSNPVPHKPGHLGIYPIALNKSCTTGVLDVENAPYVFETLKVAHRLCAEGICQGMVTGPVHKALLNQVDSRFSGHTEHLAMLCDTPNPIMSFFSPDCIVGLATTHIPLSKVSTSLTPQIVSSGLEQFYQGLIKRYGIADPKIAVLGVNPHAGEQGLLGLEEKNWLEALIYQQQSQGRQIEGPLPADTAFVPHQLAKYDAIFAMYHDQGLAPIKALYFDKLVNVTLGLPYLRCSVDHGTALDLAGTGSARPQSLIQALTLCHKLQK